MMRVSKILFITLLLNVAMGALAFADSGQEAVVQCRLDGGSLAIGSPALSSDGTETCKQLICYQSSTEDESGYIAAWDRIICAPVKSAAKNVEEEVARRRARAEEERRELERRQSDERRAVAADRQRTSIDRRQREILVEEADREAAIAQALEERLSAMTPEERGTAELNIASLARIQASQRRLQDQVVAEQLGERRQAGEDEATLASRADEIQEALVQCRLDDGNLVEGPARLNSDGTQACREVICHKSTSNVGNLSFEDLRNSISGSDVGDRGASQVVWDRNVCATVQSAEEDVSAEVARRRAEFERLSRLARFEGCTKNEGVDIVCPEGTYQFMGSSVLAEINDFARTEGREDSNFISIPFRLPNVSHGSISE